MNYTLTTVFGFLLIFVTTTLGSALVFCFNGKISQKCNALFFGFASGIMLSAMIWSLLLPAFAQTTSKSGKFSFLSVVLGFLSGCGFLLILDGITALLKGRNGAEDGLAIRARIKNRKLFLAVALHNIPEGLAVGFAFGAARVALTSSAYTSALMFAVGIAVQNFPEGAAISLPMTAHTSRTKAFSYGVASGIPEPIFAVLGYFLSARIAVLQPWLLAFAAGAMFFVVVGDLLPSLSGERQNPTFGAVAATLGFVLMMILDVALG